jgi:PAS domain S-box-containing protein
MRKAHEAIPASFSYRFIWSGVGFGALYWVLESYIHVLIFSEGCFFCQILTPDLHEIWKRLLVISLLIAFSMYAQFSINARRRTEEALMESEKKYRTLFEDALNPILVFNEKGQIIEYNQAALSFLNCTHKELLTKTAWDLIPHEGGEREEGQPFVFKHVENLETDYVVDGKMKTLLLNFVNLNIPGHTLTYSIGQDITGRKQMERNLELAHAELDQIFQTASVGMRVVDSDFNIVRMNETFAKLAATKAGDALGRKCSEVFGGQMCDTRECPLRQIVNGKERVEYSVDKHRADGVTIPCILTATPFMGPDGEFVGIVESFRDITELKEAEEVIKLERDKLHRILSNLVEGVAIVNTDLIIEFQNEVLSLQLGDCTGRKCYSAFRELSEPCAHCLMDQVVQTGKVQQVEYPYSTGRIFEQAYTPFTDADGKEKVIVLQRDITERKVTMASVMRSEQLAALGELAAGVAHEINNPINGIINYAQILLNQSREGSEVNDVAKRVIKEGDRIARIVEGLLSFARREEEHKTPVAVSEIISESLTLTEAQMRKDVIVLKKDIPIDLPEVLAQAQEIEQVFVNIISNARYALNKKYPEVDKNKILEITAKTLKEDGRALVRVSFDDRGTGIPANIIDKVMNPFFSTKPEGKRTGLGLSISHGIMSDHGGSLAIHSVEGKFTRVDVDLPVWAPTGK